MLVTQVRRTIFEIARAIGENGKTLRAEDCQEFQPFEALMMSALNKILAKHVSSDRLDRIESRLPSYRYLLLAAPAMNYGNNFHWYLF